MLAAAAWTVALASIVPGVVSLLLLWLGFRSLRRRRWLENVPTSKVEGVFLGLTELKGRAERDPPLRSYLAERETVYFRYSVEEQERRTETYTDSKGRLRTRTRTSWRVVQSGEERPPFFLRDDTGALRIDPEGAQIEAEQIFSHTCGRSDPLYYAKGPSAAIAGSTHRRRFTESAISLHQEIFVFGTARLRDDALEPEICRDPDQDLFLVSTRSEEQILRGYGWKALAALVGGWLAGCAVPVAYEVSAHGETIPDAIEGAAVVLLLVTGGYWVVALGLYLQLVYNGLVEVRHQMRRAFSMIDVELQRRRDLIPNLAQVVGAGAEHERRAHEVAAKLRGGFAAEAMPGAADARALSDLANSQTDALAGIFLHAEAHPELRTNEAFLRLSAELARTERRIALARSFYNDTVTAYEDRVHTLPDLVFARAFGFDPVALLEIEPFERNPVEVRFEGASASPEP